MKLLNQILRGAVIGVANIIPGVSGGTMMVSMGIYDTLIHCITHLFSEFKKSVKTLLPYFIGMLVGIVALASLLSFLLENYELPTNTAFIGLILGGLSPLLRKIEKKKINWAAILVFVLFFALIVGMAFIGKNDTHNTLDMNVFQMLILVLIGCVASATMIIPGVSGSMMLMLLGYYYPVLDAVNELKTALFALDFGAMVAPLLVLLPFIVGVVVGIFGVAKLIEWLLKRVPTQTYCGVLGLVVASPIAILLKTQMTGVTAVMIVLSVVTFALGFAAAMLLAKGSKE